MNELEITRQRRFPAGDPDLLKIGMRWEQALIIQLVEPSIPPEVWSARRAAHSSPW